MRVLSLIALLVCALSCEPEIRFSESLRDQVVPAPTVTFAYSGAHFLSWSATVESLRSGACVEYTQLESTPELAFLHARTLSGFADAQTSDISHPDDRLAFWINAYNVAVYEALRAAPPEERVAVSNGGFSILRSPILVVAGRRLAPDWIHHGVLRGDFEHIGLAGVDDADLNFLRAENSAFNGWLDPRLHFALACGAASCPRLPLQALRGPTLNGQLDHAVEQFLADQEIGANDSAVSSIFHWYATDFAAEGGPASFLSRYIADPGGIAANSLDFDWRTLILDPSDIRCAAPQPDQGRPIDDEPMMGPTLECDLGDTRPCGPTAPIGSCRPGVERCVDGLWADCSDAVEPSPETCNGVDDDCDGEIDNAPSPPAADPCPRDGVCVDSVVLCRDGQYICQHSAEFEMEERTCDGLDNDCDGRTDEALAPPPEFPSCVGLGECMVGQPECRADGWLCVYPDSVERDEETVCDGLDNDCDATIDEDLPNCACVDGETRACGADTGTCTRGQQRCRAGVWSGCDGVQPIPEVCDEADNDCNGVIDDGVLNACGRCGPAPEEVCDGEDNDCDGAIDEGTLNPCGGCGATPADTCNGRDDDCDGRTDEGVANACGGCGDDAPEICNGLDDDCDQIIDEGLTAPPGIECLQLGICAGHGVPGCTGAGGFGCVYPAAYEETETRCDFRDNDCDGAVDEGLLNSCQFCGPDPTEACNHLDDDCDGQEDEGCPVDPNSRPSRD